MGWDQPGARAHSSQLCLGMAHLGLAEGFLLNKHPFGGKEQLLSSCTWLLLWFGLINKTQGFVVYFRKVLSVHSRETGS